uniref:Evasin n=1 Tax=Amblyomma tuberculatum TaxID=48802 RepID=A0A6M2E4M9_9ACAR
MRSPMLHACFLALIAAAPEDVSQEPAATATPSCLEDPCNSTSSSGEESEEDYDSIVLGECYCLAPHLHTNQGNVSRVVGCIYTCEGRNCTAEEDYPCYDTTLEVFYTMEVNLTQECVPGMCRNGTCVTTGEKEECHK